MLLKGSLCAKYDQLLNQQALKLVPQPTVLTDETDKLNQHVQEYINMFKESADSIGNEAEKQSHDEHMTKFAELFGI